MKPKTVLIISGTFMLLAITATLILANGIEKVVISISIFAIWAFTILLIYDVPNSKIDRDAKPFDRR